MTSDIDKLNKHRMIQLGAKHLGPILEESKRAALSRMLNKFKEGQTDFLAEAAELSVINDIQNKLTQSSSILNHEENKV